MGVLSSLFSYRVLAAFSVVIGASAAITISENIRGHAPVCVLIDGQDDIDGLGEVVSMAFAGDRMYLGSQADHCLTVLSKDKEGTMKLVECLSRDGSDAVPPGSRKLSAGQVATIDAGSLCTSSDGKFVLFACGGSVLLFEHGDDRSLSLVTYHGEPGTFTGQLPGYLRCAWSLDEKYLFATRSRDGEIEVIRFDRNAKRMERAQIVQNLGWCIEMAVSPDGKHLYAVSRTNGLLYIFAVNPQSGILTKKAQLTDKECGVRNLKVVTSLVVSPDGKVVAVGTALGNGYLAILKRNADTGELQLVQQFNDKQGGIDDLRAPMCATFAPDSNRLFVGCSPTNGVVVLGRDATEVSFSYRETIKDPSLKAPTCVAIHDGDLFVASRPFATPEPGTLTRFRFNDEKGAAEKPD